MKPATTANNLTAQFLIEIPQVFAGARVWRRNVGRGIGWDTVQAVVRLIAAGQVKTAIELLQRRPVAFGVAGEPDIEGIIPLGDRRLGVWLGVEIKFGVDKVRESQQNFRAMILAAGGIHVIARSLEQGMADISAQIEAQRHEQIDG